MARSKLVTFSNGMEVNIYAPPRIIRTMVEEEHPKPPKPEVPEKTETLRSGREETLTFPNDPDYQERVKYWKDVEVPEWEAMVAEETDRRSALFIFKDLEVPEDWDIEAEVGAIVRMDAPDWKPTPGPLGRKRDFIQWELLADQEDALLVQITLMELAGVSQERIKSFLDSFQRPLEGEASQ